MSKEQNIIYTTYIETPIGNLYAGAVDQGICLLEFADRTILKSQIKLIASFLKKDIREENNQHFDILRYQLEEYFRSNLEVFSIPMVITGTEFQKMVWNELLKIPYGSTRTYKQQAAAINKPQAIRAVANANGLNRISIIIPCHRIIGSDGNLTGYGGGLWRKKWLLDFEKNQKSLEF